MGNASIFIEQDGVTQHIDGRVCGNDTDVRPVFATDAGSGVPTNVGDTATSTTLIAANVGLRTKFTIFNDSNARLYVDFTGGTASITRFTMFLDQNGFYISEDPIIQGLITGIWTADTASGAARITEWTA